MSWSQRGCATTGWFILLLLVVIHNQNLRNYLWMTDHSFVSYKYVSLEYYIKRYKQEKWTLKKCWANNFFKNLYYFNPFQSSSSFPILASCVIYGIYTFFNVSCGYFHITLNWWQFLQFEFQ